MIEGVRMSHQTPGLHQQPVEREAQAENVCTAGQKLLGGGGTEVESGARVGAGAGGGGGTGQRA